MGTNGLWGDGREIEKKGAGLSLKPVTKAPLCWEAPLAVLMRIKRLWVHDSGLREAWWETVGGEAGCSL